jgi:hypothetical protein
LYAKARLWWCLWKFERKKSHNSQVSSKKTVFFQTHEYIMLSPSKWLTLNVESASSCLLRLTRWALSSVQTRLLFSSPGENERTRI